MRQLGLGREFTLTNVLSYLRGAARICGFLNMLEPCNEDERLALCIQPLRSHLELTDLQALRLSCSIVRSAVDAGVSHAGIDIQSHEAGVLLPCMASLRRPLQACGCDMGAAQVQLVPATAGLQALPWPQLRALHIHASPGNLLPSLTASFSDMLREAVRQLPSLEDLAVDVPDAKLSVVSITSVRAQNVLRAKRLARLALSWRVLTAW